MKYRAAIQTPAPAAPLGPLKRALLLAAGCLAVTLGVIGILVPLLPTTCFLLLAAGCFSRSSERFYGWLTSNRWFGQYLDTYRRHRVIPRHIQIGSIAFLWAGISFSAFFLIEALWLRLLLLGVAVAVTAHIAALPVSSAGSAPMIVNSSSQKADKLNC